MKWRDLSEGPKWAELDDLPGVFWQFERVGDRYRAVGVAVRNPEGVTEDMLRAVPIRRVEASIVDHAATKSVDATATPAPIRVTATVPKPPTKRELQLTVPKTRRYPDEFFEKVASLYRRCIAGGVAPAPTIAEANDQTRTTVRAWFKEARRRGVLAPARKQGSTG